MICIEPKSMKVKDLIDLLQKCNPESKITLGYIDEYSELDNSFSIGIQEYSNEVMIATKEWFDYNDNSIES